MVSIVFTIDDTKDEIEIIRDTKSFLKEQFLIEDLGHHVKPLKDIRWNNWKKTKKIKPKELQPML